MALVLFAALGPRCRWEGGQHESSLPASTYLPDVKESLLSFGWKTPCFLSPSPAHTSSSQVNQAQLIAPHPHLPCCPPGCFSGSQVRNLCAIPSCPPPTSICAVPPRPPCVSVLPLSCSGPSSGRGWAVSAQGWAQGPAVSFLLSLPGAGRVPGALTAGTGEGHVVPTFEDLMVCEATNRHAARAMSSPSTCSHIPHYLKKHNSNSKRMM